MAHGCIKAVFNTTDANWTFPNAAAAGRATFAAKHAHCHRTSPQVLANQTGQNLSHNPTDNHFLWILSACEIHKHTPTALLYLGWLQDVAIVEKNVDHDSFKNGTWYDENFKKHRLIPS